MDNFISVIEELYKSKNWKKIVETYHNHPERNRVLWVYPSEENFVFLKACLNELHNDSVLSIGCGSGLLEWMITEATGIPVSGVEIDKAWWHCKYAPPTFIPLILTSKEPEDRLKQRLHQSDNTALLFCYFNNRTSFEEYIKYYSGNTLIIIGPGDGKNVHTDPKPFDDIEEPWKLYKSQEVRDSKDFIAVYCKI
ncbi:hypothetical protein ACJJTC_004872 [Scirpophaga incertulas]